MKIKRLFERKINASTLVEVTTALVIISMVFSLAMLIYLNVQRSGFSSRKLACDMMLEEVYNTTLKSKNYVNTEVSYDDITVYQEVLPGSVPDLLIIQLEARDHDGKLLGEQKHLVYAPAQP